MRFEPPPENCFLEVIDTYFQRCKAVCPKLRAIAGKWRFEDLIPGLSDFDTRLIFADDTGVEDWMAMSLAVGMVHTELARERPEWARILEHLPGLNLTEGEILNPAFYYPEFKQWTYYQGDEQVLKSIGSYLANKAWTKRDELFHLKKFATYYGPYIRGIDPPINLGSYESKYALHSRFMHYFNPPMQAAVSLALGRTIQGKQEALRLSRDIFPNSEVIDMILGAVDKHYEIPEYYCEPRLYEIEQALERYLQGAYAALADSVSLIQVERGDTPEQLKARIAAVPIDPVESFFSGVKFSRFMKGRLLFYATPILWFDSTLLIHVELRRIGQLFVEQPLVAFGIARYGRKCSGEDVLKRLRGEILSPETCDGVLNFVRVVSEPTPEGKEREQALEAADSFDAVQMMVETLSKEIVH